MSNEFTIDRVQYAIDHYREWVGDNAQGAREDVIDILTDLRHYCDHHKLAFFELSLVATRHYIQECYDLRTPDITTKH